MDACKPLTINQYGRVDVNDQMKTAVDGIFAGGDVVGNGTTVEAVNDGKTASWWIHKHVQGLFGQTVPETPLLPQFFTEVDQVDISIDVCGIKFPNPFGLASATPTTTAAMIKRAFEAGWGWAVTKTFGMDHDLPSNVSPRIVKGETSGLKFGPHQSSFLNIELISEKSASYWLKTIKELKQLYPKHIVVASIMSGFVQSDWQLLAKASEDAGADAIELNLSCPHGMGERGMGMACGQDPKLVHEICKWVRAATKLPFFAKLTPNITSMVKVAKAAKEGGADGVTAINTVSGLMGLTPNAIPWPAVGAAQKTTYGGVSGNAIRPMALKAVSQIARALPGYPIMGVGGIESAETTLQFIHVGAPIVQICSAVQNQDFTIVEDYITGLKALMYINANSKKYSNWIGQSPPAVVKDRKIDSVGLPKFGDYLVKRRELIQADVEKHGFLTEPINASVAPTLDSVAVPALKEFVGRALDRITKWNNLDPECKEEVVALVNDDMCINCGKCVMVCNDSGSFSFSFGSHIF